MARNPFDDTFKLADFFRDENKRLTQELLKLASPPPMNMDMLAGVSSTAEAIAKQAESVSKLSEQIGGARLADAIKSAETAIGNTQLSIAEQLRDAGQKANGVIGPKWGDAAQLLDKARYATLASQLDSITGYVESLKLEPPAFPIEPIAPLAPPPMPIRRQSEPPKRTSRLCL